MLGQALDSYAPQDGGHAPDLKTAFQALESKAEFPEALRGRKILLATESLGPTNGVSRTTQMLVDYLRDNGVNLAVVAPRYRHRPMFKRSKSQGPELRLNGYPLPYNPDLAVVYPFRLDRVYLSTFGEAPDAIYLASPASVGFQFLVQLRQLQNPPPILLNFQTDLSSYSEILFRPPIDQYAVWLLRLVQRFLFSHERIHTIFYPSRMVQRYLQKAGIPDDKMVKLGRGVDTDLFNPMRRDEAYHKELAPNGEIVLVCVARLAPEKGFRFLGEVALKLKEKGLPFKLLIVGGNKNPAVEDEVRRCFDAVQGQVVFTGFLEGLSLSRAYASADIFLHCSVTETFGLVVLESMASGVPVIARDEGGPSDIIDSGNSGVLTPPNDLEQYVNCVERLATDHAARAEMALQARKQALDTTWDKINNQVACQISEALAQRPVRPRGPVGSRSPTLPPFRPEMPTWRPMFVREEHARLLQALIPALRVEVAIGIIFMFWTIAVVPLLICGFLHAWLPPSLEAVLGY